MPRGVGVRVPLSAQARHFFECRVFAYKGTREALLRNSCHIYNPSKPPFEKGDLWQCDALLNLRSTFNFKGIDSTTKVVQVLEVQWSGTM